MRYYIVDNKGTVHADGDSKAWAEAILEQIVEDHPEYKNLELEIVTDADEEETEG